MGRSVWVASGGSLLPGATELHLVAVGRTLQVQPAEKFQNARDTGPKLQGKNSPANGNNEKTQNHGGERRATLAASLTGGDCKSKW